MTCHLGESLIDEERDERPRYRASGDVQELVNEDPQHVIARSPGDDGGIHDYPVTGIPAVGRIDRRVRERNELPGIERRLQHPLEGLVGMRDHHDDLVGPRCGPHLVQPAERFLGERKQAVERARSIARRCETDEVRAASGLEGGEVPRVPHGEEPDTFQIGVGRDEPRFSAAHIGVEDVFHCRVRIEAADPVALVRQRDRDGIRVMSS